MSFFGHGIKHLVQENVMSVYSAEIGKLVIEVSDAHIYLSDTVPPTYDFVPWNIVGHLISRANLSKTILIDIGANVGDSAAHFRRHSDAEIQCIEPSEYFFEILSRNAGLLGNVKLINKLLAPASMVGKVAFVYDGQTGSTKAVSESDEENLWSGPYATFSELLSDPSAQYIVKSDTDGFDAELMQALLDCPNANTKSVPIVFFEGPSSTQTAVGDFDQWIKILDEFQKRGYGLLFLTNIGMPYCFLKSDRESVVSVLNALREGYKNGRALCHYYDVIAFSDSIDSPEARLQAAWPPSFYSRS